MVHGVPAAGDSTGKLRQLNGKFHCQHPGSFPFLFRRHGIRFRIFSILFPAPTHFPCNLPLPENVLPGLRRQFFSAFLLPHFIIDQITDGLRYAFPVFFKVFIQSIAAAQISLDRKSLLCLLILNRPVNRRKAKGKIILNIKNAKLVVNHIK